MNALNKKSLIIFGSGYLGSHAARFALNAGMQVTALTRNVKQANALIEAGVQHTLTDNLESDTWHASAAHHYDYALNCVSAGPGGIDAYRLSYIEGMRSILSWLKHSRVGTFVYTSSTGVYPQNDGSQVSENAKTGGSERADILREAERLLESSHGISRYFILRLSGIYGPGRHYLLNALLKGETVFPGTGTYPLNLAHIDDITRAIFDCFNAASTVPGTVYNISDGNPANKAEVVEWLAEATGSTKPTFNKNAKTVRQTPPKNRLILSDKIKRELTWLPLHAEFKSCYQEILNNVK